MNLLGLPAEIIYQILKHLTYPDLISFSSTTRRTHNYCSPTHHLLWQSAFLHAFDDPRDRWLSLTKTPRDHALSRANDIDWFAELRRRVIALRYVHREGLMIEDGNAELYESVVATVLVIVETAKAVPTPAEEREGRRAEVDDRDLSLNLAVLPTNYHLTPEFDGLVRGLPAATVKRNAGSGYGSDYSVVGMPGAWGTGTERDRVPGRPVTRGQVAREMDKIVRSEAAMRLHVLCGLTEWEERDDRAVGRARRITYDWDDTNERNEFGPWKEDGSGEVDWRRLEAVMTVVTRQFALAVKGRMTLPQGFCFSLPYRTLIDPTVPEDWAGVQRPWCGTYVFLHWEDLVEYNAFQNAANRPTLEHGPEACGGLMKVDLKLRPELKDDPKLSSKMPFCDDLPPLYFSGLSKSYDFHMATQIRGMCCLTPGGKEVRWRYIVHYSGSDQWQLEGVQPGGIRSGCVYGTWTSVHHEEGGPVGPFLYTPEELCKPTSVVLVPQRT